MSTAEVGSKVFQQAVADLEANKVVHVETKRVDDVKLKAMGFNSVEAALAQLSKVTKEKDALAVAVRDFLTLPDSKHYLDLLDSNKLPGRTLVSQIYRRLRKLSQRDE